MVLKTNRSIPASSVVPVLIYPDVREAVAWLIAAFGFVERVRIGEDHRHSSASAMARSSSAMSATTADRRDRVKSLTL
jgi:uncharacterized glyoxalase superfamily protein PhnB